MKLKSILLGAVATVAFATGAMAQEVTLRVHQFLPAQATIPATAITPWAEAVQDQSDGRIAVELYPAMQLGGAPDSLFSQAQDGVVDVIWTVLGYTPGRFPKSEVFELPFLMSNSAEETSAAFYNYVMENSADEFESVHVLALHTHGPGLFHTQDPVNALEDIQGMKIRGGSRIISNMLAQLGAEPVGMPVPQTTEALSRGVINGTTVPWEVTPSIRVAELVTNHTGFSGENGLYTQTFGFVMNRGTYEGLPDDLKAVIDANSGLETSKMFGRAMDAGDDVGLQIAEDAGNNIITLDEAETARWKEAAQPTIDQWFADMDAIGIDGEALYAAAQEAMAAERQ
ncbi:TRAP transporter substrate-binding protein [Pelagibacterium halotolerans]|uniref:TRAP-type C4-dicarboxylate transport system, periplasmic component n=1 Tax=Pelagibacterium halotolerans (strain DSM 22347 / JCM 15775 / CGMCC 1.7692 / B2) TaxID=1082931 RepID=G4R7V9_PELHB|nr:TRAP transporter substrate-binding protein [Pelagibacterium halotolerans]AEQ50254.1 TRAP transporter solute receptor, unknown substrate 3 [Pelagibacterium halotolerans B2]QJR19752.1 TRAP transporter substrate-binding protein [Pelagibacterium halotolerans]SEA51981.1 TRAP-type C4-dicarboxylate transport system, substrate-binding protein [Pelagibacterium halotolerans]